MSVLSSITANPLFVQQTRKPHRLTTAVLMKGGIRLTIVAVFAAIIASILRGETAPVAGILIVSAFLFLAAIPFAAYATAISTVREVNQENYELLLLTTLDNSRINYGLLYQSFYRIRVLLLLLLILTPVLSLGMSVANGVSVIGSINYCNSMPNAYICTMQHPSYADIVTGVFVPMLIMAAAWGFILVGGAAGVTLGLMWRNSFLSGISALVLSFVLGFITLAVSGVVSGSALGVIATALVPYLGFAVLMRFSQIFTRRITAHR